MEKGIVLEQDGNQVVVLTPDGKFKRIKVEGEMPAIGEEIAIKPVVNKVAFLPNVMMAQRKWMAAAAAVFLLLASPVAFRTFSAAAPTAAYLSVDINPSLELRLDAKGKIVGSDSLNQDGAKLLGSVKIKGLEASEAVDELVSEAVAEGYLAQGKTNMVLVSLARGDQAKNIPADLAGKLKERVAKNLSGAGLAATVESVDMPMEVREEAQKAGVSAGKFAVYLASRDAGLEISLDDLKKSPVSAAVGGAGGNLRTLLYKAHTEKDFTAKVQQYWKKDGKASNASNNLLVNGSFEAGSFTGWDKGGVYEQTVSTRSAKDGSYAAILGKADYDGSNSDVPVGLNWLSREMKLPAGKYVALKFRYRLETYDGLEKDAFSVLLKDERGKTLETLYRISNKGVHGIKQDLEWKEVKVDLSKYTGQTVKMVFGLTNGDASNNTWVTVDDVRISYQ